MANELILDSLKVSGFRGFENLEVPHLGRVNLITGKNNVGKTGLLEALQVYARRGEPNVLQSLLVRRDETYVSSSAKTSEAARLLEDVRHVFHGRTEVKETDQKLVIGSLHQAENRVVVSVETQNQNVSEDELFSYFPTGNAWIDKSAAEILRMQTSRRVFIIHFGTKAHALPFAPESFRNRGLARAMGEELRHTFIWSRGLDTTTAYAYWDQALISATDNEVIEALQIVAPNLERVNLVGIKEGNPDRVAMVRLATRNESIPMRSLGEGMNRLFGLSLALVSSGGGLLLVDEIETGLHYSVQAQMWRLVFQTARRLGIQVFATTHSKDCYEAFAQVAAEEAESEGVLIRLENKQDRVVAVPFDEAELGYVVSEDIEVR